MTEAAQILNEAVARLYALCDALLPINHTSALAVETLGIEVEQLVSAL